MERDGIIAHGMAAFIKDSMMKRSDGYQIAIDNTTGLVAAYNPRKHIFLSPMLDGPLQFNRSIDDKQNVSVVSKYGKTFTVLKVPYSFNLLLHELRAMNVALRIITPDLMDHITSMACSDNLQKVMKRPNDKVSAVIQGIMDGSWVKERPTIVDEHDAEQILKDAETVKLEPLPEQTKVISIGDKVTVDLSKVENKDEYKGEWEVEAIAGDDTMIRQGDSFKLVRSAFIKKELTNETPVEMNEESKEKEESDINKEVALLTKPSEENELEEEQIEEMNLDEVKETKEKEEEESIKKDVPEIVGEDAEKKTEEEPTKSINID